MKAETIAPSIGAFVMGLAIGMALPSHQQNTVEAYRLGVADACLQATEQTSGMTYEQLYNRTISERKAEKPEIIKGL